MPLALLIVIVNPLVYREGETLLIRGGEVLGYRIEITLEALVYGGAAALRLFVLALALALFSACVDPDDLLRLVRRVSYRSALTASLATRLAPVLARDALRMSDAARCRPQPPARAAVARATLAGALDRAVEVAAALELRGYASARRPPRYATAWSRHDVRVAVSAAAIALTAVVTRVAGAGGFEAYPSLEVAAEPGGPRGARAAAAARARPVRGRAALAWGWRMPEPVLRAESFGYRYPGAARRRARRPDAGARARARSRSSSGESGSGKSTLLRAACGLVPHFHGGDARGELEVAGMSMRDHGPNDLAASCATLLQDPETQVVMSGVRSELALPLEQRGHDAAAIARAVEEAALELGRRAPARPPHRHALGRRAAARRAGGGGRREAVAARAGRADLAARPGRGRRPGLAPAPPERGVGDGGAAGRAPASSAACRPPTACSRWRAAASSWMPRPAEFLDWATERASVLATPARGCSRWPGSARRRSR